MVYNTFYIKHFIDVDQYFLCDVEFSELNVLIAKFWLPF